VEGCRGEWEGTVYECYTRLGTVIILVVVIVVVVVVVAYLLMLRLFLG